MNQSEAGQAGVPSSTVALLLTVVALLTSSCLAAELSPQTLRAFDRYIQLKEERLQQQMASGHFLWGDGEPDRNEQLRAGAVLIEPSTDQREVRIPNGLIHDWVGAIFIPGATVDKTIALVQDYSNHSKVYR